MKHLRTTIFFFILTIICLSVTLIFSHSEKSAQTESVIKSEIETALAKKLNVLNRFTDELKENQSYDDLSIFFQTNKESLSNNGMGLFLLKDSSLILWTDRVCPLEFKHQMHSTSEVQRLSNGWYLIQKEKTPDYTILGTILLKREYNYNNPYLPGYYTKGLEIPDNTEIRSISDSGVPITLNGETIFRINSNKHQIDNNTKHHILNTINILGILSLILCCIFAYLYISKKTNRPALMLIPLFIDLSLIRWILHHFSIPRGWHNTDLFSPQLFAESMFNRSLGELLINALLLFIFTIVFHKQFNIKLPRNKHYPLIARLISISSAAISLFLLIYSIGRFESIINNSSIPFSFNRILSLNAYSFTGLIISLLFFISSLLIIDKLIICNQKLSTRKFFHITFFSLLVLIFILDTIFIKSSLSHKTYLCIALICAILFHLRIKQLKFNYFTGLILSIIISLLITFYFNGELDVKEEQQQKVLAMNLSNERDAGAEFFIKEMNQNLYKDSTLKAHLKDGNFNAAFSYFEDTYMKGYLDKYEFQISTCTNNDSLIIEPDNISVHCQQFFQEITDNYGISLPGTDFFFLDNNNGRISYLGTIQTSELGNEPLIIYIELDSQILSEGPGYPELLLDKKLMPKPYSKHLSFAKYNDSLLITSKGDYNYSQIFNLDTENKEYYFTESEKWDHLIYSPNKDTKIIVSQNKKDFNDYFIFFTYIFFILFILLNLMWLTRFIIKLSQHKKTNSSFKNRIQSYFVILISLSIISIGTISIIFYIQRYKSKQEDAIQEKMQSVQIELSHKLGNEQQLSPETQEYLNFLLVKFSNVFYTDINLFGLDGKLLASSRQEVYDKGLVGRRLEPDAFYRLKNKSQGYFVQNETIGNMNYLSAYIPFKNSDNHILAYINLPYFSRQNQFSEEISSLTVALINVYLILFLITILVAIITSNQLTRPLKMIQRSIRKMDIKERSQKIDYTGDDELGGLVREYNKKVDELQESAQRLAQSERESAWREMAKQIAHEIKNPLTPMKLSVQHLEKAYKDKDPDLDFMFSKVSRTLIEQIDSLSHIATEFSNFAKIRVNNKQSVDLIERIKTATQLFDGLSKASVQFDAGDLKSAIIMADNEQILRIFNNLLKNAVQAIPNGKQGIINISIVDDQSEYLIIVKDNGKGIPKDIQSRIFTPNFTTKSSGMGLGLSIVKGIIENSNGRIEFKTESNMGTSFYIHFPKKK